MNGFKKHDLRYKVSDEVILRQAYSQYDTLYSSDYRLYDFAGLPSRIVFEHHEDSNADHIDRQLNHGFNYSQILNRGGRV